MTTEIWKDIPDYEGVYQASNLGRIRRTTTKRVIRVRTTKQGYCRITLHHKAKRRKFSVHRLVASAFLYRPTNHQSLNVHHKDYVRNNNRADNLMWVSPEYNQRNKMCVSLTAKQLNIITNSIAKDSSGESRSAKAELALQLFPDDVAVIQNAISNHPINQRWDEYIKASPQEQALFLLPEA